MGEVRHWLLLRGLARGVGHWGSFAQVLKARFPQDQFEFLDLPGNGALSSVPSPLNISDYVYDLRARSQFVKAHKKFHILSVSLGSMVTVEWMRQFPQEVERALLVCTSSSGFSPFYERFQPRNLLKLPSLLRFHSSPEEWEQVLLSMVTNSPERRAAEWKALSEYSTRYPLNWANLWRQLVAASRYTFPPFAPGEIHLVGSHGDRLVAPNCTVEIGKKWGLTPVMHPWAGHDIAIDDPQWLLEQMN